MDELVTRENDDCPKCGRVGDAANTCTLSDCPEWSPERTGTDLAIPDSWGDQKGVRVKVDPAHIGRVLAEFGSASHLLDELEVPAGTLRERIYSLAESFNAALEGHKDEIARLEATRCWCGWPLEPHTLGDHKRHPEWTS